MSPYRDRFITYKPLNGHMIHIANKSMFNTKETNDVLIEVPCDRKINRVILKDTLYAPDIHATLVSIGRFDAKKCVTIIRKGSLTIEDKTGKKICQILCQENNLYQLLHENIEDNEDDTELVEANSGTDSVSIEELHCKLGYSSQGYI